MITRWMLFTYPRFINRSIPCVNNMRINRIIVFCKVRYGTCTILWYEQMHLLLMWCGLLLSRDFLFLLQSSLACIVARGWPRSSAAARSSRLPTTGAPTLLAIALLAPTISLFSLTTCTSDNKFYLVRCASFLVALPHEVVPKKTTLQYLAAVKRSLPLLWVHANISNKCVVAKNKWLGKLCASGIYNIKQN